jgi:hypothetical protein
MVLQSGLYYMFFLEKLEHFYVFCTLDLDLDILYIDSRLKVASLNLDKP